MRPSESADQPCSDTPVVRPDEGPGTQSFHLAHGARADPTVTGTEDLSQDGRLAGPGGPARPLGRFGKFELLEQYPGGMGIVYMARDTELDRIVALKRLYPDERLRPAEIDRFLREVQAIAQLKHPQIIPIYEFAQIDGERYFTTEFIAGGNLSENRARFRENIRAAVTLMEKIARAVHHAHANGIIHRDLKPANILLTGADEPRVSDFGLAKALDSDAETTATGTVLGTPAYMSPEQARGATGTLDGRTDIWSLGVILYELLTGTRPFPGSTREEVTPRILNDDPPPPSLSTPQVDERLAAVILKCLQKEPSDRYVSAEALADDLKSWLDDRPFEVHLPERRGSEAPRRRLSRRTFLWAGAAGAMIAAVPIGFRVAGFFSDEEPETQDQRNVREGIQAQLLSWATEPLFGPTGEPRWQRWILGRVAPTKPDNIFTIATGTLSLLELLPDPKLKDFRLTAEVRHNDSAAGAVGIYVGRIELAERPGIHWFFSYEFADRGSRAASEKGPDGQPLSLAEVRMYGVGRKTNSHARTDIRLPFRPTLNAASQWRTLVLEVRNNEEIAASWGVGGPVGRTDPREMAKWARGLDEKPGTKSDGPYPEFKPYAGIGLFVEASAASFRNVVIEPLLE